MTAMRLGLTAFACLAVMTACSGVSPNSASNDPWSDDGGDSDSASSGTGGGSANGGSGSSSSSSSGSGACGSCSADSDCQRSCGSPPPNQVWCCSTSVGCYEFTSTSCPMSQAGGSGSGVGGGNGGAATGAACNGSSSCASGMKCCVGLSGQGGGTCQASCSNGVETCQRNSDCSGGGICLLTVCLPGLGGGGGGGRPRDAGGG